MNDKEFQKIVDEYPRRVIYHHTDIYKKRKGVATAGNEIIVKDCPDGEYGIIEIKHMYWHEDETETTSVCMSKEQFFEIAAKIFALEKESND